ncbi:MAG: anti-sigma factor [Phycisphaeraceae bacterium]|nr:MAG: anti-sigma factor [Phycisphaeraceae bacterium]
MTPDDPHNPNLRPMPTDELLELVGPDALGLLDDEDRAAFDAGFRAAPATLQELIRAEQARIAASGDLLPDVEPPASLRERVLGRIAGESARRKAPPAPTAARSVAHEPVSRPPRLQRARRVSAGWRVATVALAVAVVVLGVLHIQLKQEFNGVRNSAQLDLLIDRIGIDHLEATLFDPASQRAQFKPVADFGRAKAMLWHSPDSREARLYVLNFPDRTGYKLVVLDENDNPTSEVISFASDGKLLRGIDVNIDQTGPIRLAIMTDEAEPRLLFIAEVKLA